MKKHPGTLRYIYWNVKDWGNDEGSGNGQNSVRDITRANRIRDIILAKNADIVTFAEVCDPDIQTLMQRVMPGWFSHITVDDATKNLLTISKVPVAISQTELEVPGWNNMRQSPIISLGQAGQDFTIIPVHTKAGSKATNAKTRHAHMQKLSNMAHIFNERSIPLLVIGDINTMGVRGTQTGEQEYSKLKKSLAKRLREVEKNKPVTWRGVGADSRFSPANLDHAFATQAALSMLKRFNSSAKVHVGGWPELEDNEAQEQWVRDHSDHAYLMVDIQMQ